MLAPMAATKAAMAAVNLEEVEGEAISPPILRGDPSEVYISLHFPPTPPSLEAV
jgi:hypothetical protein